MTDCLQEFDPCVTCTTQRYCESAVNSSKVVLTAMMKFADIVAQDENTTATAVYGDEEEIESIQALLTQTVGELREVDCMYTDEQIKALVTGEI